MAKYQRKTDGIDPERGEQLTTRLSDLKAVYAKESRVPIDKQDKIGGCFLRWFCGYSEEEAVNGQDALVEVFVSTLMNRQREGVKRYFDTCGARSPKKAGSDDDTDDDRAGEERVTYVDISRDKAGQGEISPNKKKEENKLTEGNKVYFSSIPGEPGTATPPAGGLCVTAAPGESVTVYPYTDEPPVVVTHADLITDPVGTMLDFLRPAQEDRAKIQNTLAARMNQATRATFDAVCWKFLKDAEAITTRRHNANQMIRAQMAKEKESEWEAFFDNHRQKRDEWDTLCGESEKFEPQSEEAVKVLFGRLKAYKPTTGKGKKGGEA